MAPVYPAFLLLVHFDLTRATLPLCAPQVSTWRARYSRSSWLSPTSRTVADSCPSLRPSSPRYAFLDPAAPEYVVAESAAEEPARVLPRTPDFGEHRPRIGINAVGAVVPGIIGTDLFCAGKVCGGWSGHDAGVAGTGPSMDASKRSGSRACNYGACRSLD